MLINVYIYGANSTVGSLLLTTGEKNLDCILIGQIRMRSDNAIITQSQTCKVLSLGGGSARLNVESITDTGSVYAIRRYVFIGNFNKDMLKVSITDNPNMRLEIRNEYGVLIWDNGLPLPDGTYPPDAKNRAGLSGLHGAPAVINPKLETALMGDETNKEGVQE